MTDWRGGRGGVRGCGECPEEEGTLMDYIRASELGYCRAICSGALLYDPTIHTYTNTYESIHTDDYSLNIDKAIQLDSHTPLERIVSMKKRMYSLFKNMRGC